MIWLLIIGGFLLLVLGGEVLVRGASRLASSFGVSPLVIGLTVVAFGSSAPELAVSLQAVFQGVTEVTMGNVIGSNILNILLVLGLASVVTPILVRSDVIKLHLPIMLGLTGLMFLMSTNKLISRLEGAILLVLIVGYTILQFWHKKQPEKDQKILPKGNTLINSIMVLIGLAMLVFGAQLLVNGAVQAATALGISTLIIGLTVVAIGTSLPEIVISVLAAIKGERDMAIGNVLGSNIFNIGFILGGSALVNSKGLIVTEQALSFDIPIMVLAALMCFPAFITKKTVDRWEGILFLALYVLYTIFLLFFGNKLQDMFWVMGVIFGTVMLLIVGVELIQRRLSTK